MSSWADKPVDLGQSASYETDPQTPVTVSRKVMTRNPKQQRRLRRSHLTLVPDNQKRRQHTVKPMAVLLLNTRFHRMAGYPAYLTTSTNRVANALQPQVAQDHRTPRASLRTPKYQPSTFRLTPTPQARPRQGREGTKCFLVPPLVLARLAANHPDPSVRASATRTLAQDRELRTARTNAQQLANSHPTGTSATNAPPPSTLSSFAGRQFSPQRTIYTAQNRNDLRATEQLRTEGHPAVADPSANSAYDTLGIAYRYFADVHGRDSLDGLGAPLIGIIHSPTITRTLSGTATAT
jgi:hypothetical protein